jgi:hypothetical protein
MSRNRSIMGEPELAELIEDVKGAFGSCTRLRECMEDHELREDLKRVASGEETLQEWLDIQLGVEDGCGTPIALVAQVEQRLDDMLEKKGLQPMKDRRKYRRLAEELRREREQSGRGEEHMPGWREEWY